MEPNQHSQAIHDHKLSWKKGRTVLFNKNINYWGLTWMQMFLSSHLCSWSASTSILVSWKTSYLFVCLSAWEALDLDKRFRLAYEFLRAFSVGKILIKINHFRINTRKSRIFCGKNKFFVVRTKSKKHEIFGNSRQKFRRFVYIPHVKKKMTL